jgi:hypothetical protein
MTFGTGTIPALRGISAGIGSADRGGIITWVELADQVPSRRPGKDGFP